MHAILNFVDQLLLRTSLVTAPVMFASLPIIATMDTPISRVYVELPNIIPAEIPAEEVPCSAGTFH